MPLRAHDSCEMLCELDAFVKEAKGRSHSTGGETSETLGGGEGQQSGNDDEGERLHFGCFWRICGRSRKGAARVMVVMMMMRRKLQQFGKESERRFSANRLEEDQGGRQVRVRPAPSRPYTLPLSESDAPHINAGGRPAAR